MGDTETNEPRIPPGQTVTKGWPVLHAGWVPTIDLHSWRFHIDGLVEKPQTFHWEAFLRLGYLQVTADMHCVTGWSRLDNRWEGVPFQAVYAAAAPLPQAQYVLVRAAHGWTCNVPLRDLLQDDVLFAYRHDGQPLSAEHGGPLRLVVPHLYGWKSAKWVEGLTFLEKDVPGYWEQAGYHMHGDPWKEERFAPM
ncbi:MAG: sulfite oxidase-like oxidoreductase [Firmicutes bacterium]|nr:sulfite oxidase-like oxidoreductase [Bacillota bacterium]